MSEMQNVLAIANEVKEKHANFSISEVNDHCVRLAVFTGEYDWHHHLTQMNYSLFLKVSC